MRIALIPAAGYEEYARRGSAHMILAQELWRAGYTELYHKMALDVEPVLVIMDNGADEGVTLTNRQMVGSIFKLNPDEFILPDALGDAARTITESTKFLKYTERLVLGTTKFMGVVQGTTLEELMHVAEWFAAQPLVVSLGIPRHLPATMNMPTSIRIDLATNIEAKFPDRFQIHFLGGIAAWPREPKAIRTYTPFVRSIDTSLPFTYTAANVRLTNDRLPVLKRPPNYFAGSLFMDEALLSDNIKTYVDWCSDV